MDLDYGEVVGDDDDVNPSLEDLRKTSFYDDLAIENDETEDDPFLKISTTLQKRQYQVLPCTKRDKSICCWWCCHTFKTTAVTIPTHYDERRDRWKFFGVFCSASCAKSYSHKEFRGGDMGYKSSIFTKFVREVYKIPPPIAPAPPRQSLKIFGGVMTIAQFRKHSNTTISGIVLPPHDPCASIIMNRPRCPNLIPRRTYVVCPTADVGVAPTPLKLSRKTPKEIKGTIFETMNITRTSKTIQKDRVT